MEDSKWFISELIGKLVLVKTHWGMGTKDVSLRAGEYKGLLLGFDGAFIKLEYEMMKFSAGSGAIAKDVILINVAYIVSLDEYRNKDG
jgi:hypothetical protein